MEKLLKEYKYVNFLPKNKANVLKQLIKNFKGDKSFYIADLDQVRRNISEWENVMPNVKIYYAVKCNPDKKMIKHLINAKCGFDCATPYEIDMCLSLGANPSNIIYANPCKPKCDIEYAFENGINLMTFDSLDELNKIKLIHPKTNLVMRILVDDSKSMWKLGLKYGISENEFEFYIKKCFDLKLNLTGISFHVGSECYDSSMFSSAIKLTHKCYLIAEKYNFNIRLIDIGGGFPSCDHALFKKLGLAVNKELENRFAKNIQFIAEPGRYIVASAYTLSVNIFSKKVKTLGNSEETYMYYVNDGIFGSFGTLPIDRNFNPNFIYMKEKSSKVHKKSIIWGPTCANIDCLLERGTIPEMETGDWIYFENMGAYTISLSSDFNGVEKSKVYYINE